MSADNGIYILKTSKKDRIEYRVAHAVAIDNNWYEENELHNLGWYLYKVFGNSEVFTSRDDAFQKAYELENKAGWTEYGICEIDMSKYNFPD